MAKIINFANVFGPLRSTSLGQEPASGGANLKSGTFLNADKSVAVVIVGSATSSQNAGIAQSGYVCQRASVVHRPYSWHERGGGDGGERQDCERECAR